MTEQGTALKRIFDVITQTDADHFVSAKLFKEYCEVVSADEPNFWAGAEKIIDRMRPSSRSNAAMTAANKLGSAALTMGFGERDRYAPHISEDERKRKSAQGYVMQKDALARVVAESRHVETRKARYDLMDVVLRRLRDIDGTFERNFRFYSNNTSEVRSAAWAVKIPLTHKVLGPEDDTKQYDEGLEGYRVVRHSNPELAEQALTTALAGIKKISDDSTHCRRAINVYLAAESDFQDVREQAVIAAREYFAKPGEQAAEPFLHCLDAVALACLETDPEAKERSTKTAVELLNAIPAEQRLAAACAMYVQAGDQTVNGQITEEMFKIIEQAEPADRPAQLLTVCRRAGGYGNNKELIDTMLTRIRSCVMALEPAQQLPVLLKVFEEYKNRRGQYNFISERPDEFIELYVGIFPNNDDIHEELAKMVVMAVENLPADRHYYAAMNDGSSLVRDLHLHEPKERLLSLAIAGVANLPENQRFSAATAVSRLVEEYWGHYHQFGPQVKEVLASAKTIVAEDQRVDAVSPEVAEARQQEKIRRARADEESRQKWEAGRPAREAAAALAEQQRQAAEAHRKATEIDLGDFVKQLSTPAPVEPGQG